jgi:molybdopterin-containing oxidoreductase family membrane subunit
LENVKNFKVYGAEGGGKVRYSEAISVVVLLLIVLIGALGIYQIHFNTLMPIEPYESAVGMPWRLLVALYVFFVVSTTGLCIVASLGEVFGVKQLEPIVKEGLLLALVTILIGLMTIGLEIERVERGYFAIAGHTNPESVMFWMIMFYVLYVIFLIIEMWFYFRDDLIKQAEEKGIRGFIGKLLSLSVFSESLLKSDRETNKQFAKAIGFVTVVTAIIAHSNLGALFAVNYLPFWHGALLPVYFILSAIVSGAALTIIAAILTDWIRGVKIAGERYEALQMLRFVLGFSLVVTAFFTAWKFIIKAYPTAGWFSNEAVSVFLVGEYAFNFWFFEILIGLLIPLIILASPAGRSVDGLFVAAFLTIVGIFFLRIDLVMGGQVLKLISGIGVEAMSVHPFEVMATAGFLSLVVLMYYVLYRILPMEG